MKLREFVNQLQFKSQDNDFLFLEGTFNLSCEKDTNQLMLNDKPLMLAEKSTIVITPYAKGVYTDKFLNEITKAGIRLFKLDWYGNPVWQLNPKTRTNAFLMKAQILFNEPQFNLLRSKLIEKLINEKLKSEGNNEISIRAYRNGDMKKWINTAMNLEGRFASKYWESFRKSIKLDDYVERRSIKGIKGKRRDNKNATDAVNALLNLGYGILAHNITFELYEHGLEPTIGFYHAYTFHESQNPRYSLTWDIIEPYRVLVDEIVFNHINDIDLSGFEWEIKEQKRFLLLQEQPHKVGKISLSPYKTWIKIFTDNLPDEYPFLYEYKKYLEEVLKETGIKDADQLRRIIGRLKKLGRTPKEIIKPEDDKPIKEPIHETEKELIK